MKNKKKSLIPFYKNLVDKLSGHGLKKYSVVNKINNYTKSKLKTNYAVVQGHKMYLDPTDNLSLSIFGIYEPMETELVKKELKPNNVALDIGAFIGYYSLIFARLVGNDGKVFAFELNPTPFSTLKKNIEINNYQNVILENKGVSNTDKNLKSGEHLVRLDTYFKNRDPKVDFIKMDIEGAEMRALEGMTSLIENNDNIRIMTEFHPTELKKFGTNPEDYLNQLRNFDFNIYHIDNKLKSIKPVSNDYLLAKFPSMDSSTNLFCKRH